jgi:photosystem II stability/assembly factor-like uncharacterized protein
MDSNHSNFRLPSKGSRENNQSPSSETTNPFYIEKKASAAERNPLLRSKDYGQTWQNVSYNLPADLQVSFLERKESEIVLASDNYGVFLSSKNKTQWTSIGDSLPHKKINALHVANETIYCGVYKAGIFQTTDEGATWESLNFNLPDLSVHAIGVFEKLVLVGTDSGIFKLSDNSSSWEPSYSNVQVLSIYGFEGKLVAGTSQGTLISKDYGESWQWIRKEGAVHYTHHVGKRIVELCINGDQFFSDDWGKNWISSSYQPRQDSYIYELVKAGNYLIMSNNYGIHRSSDHGQSWKLIYTTESMVFFDFLVVGQDIYGGTRTWDEYRGRK